MTTMTIAQKKIPIGTITLKMDTSLYQRMDDRMEQVKNDYIKRNTTLPFVQKEGDWVELADGQFLQYAPHNYPEIHFGHVLVFGTSASVCSRMGQVLRSVKKGTSFPIKEMKSYGEYEYYRISDREWICSAEDVHRVYGYFKPAMTLMMLTRSGEPYLLQTDKIGYYGIDGYKILLLVADGVWLDTSLYDGEFETL